MSKEKCPFCGADRFNLIEYRCHTATPPMTEVSRRDKDCYNRQIAQLTERLEAWRVTKEGWDEYWESLNEPALQKLKDLEEI